MMLHKNAKFPLFVSMMIGAVIAVFLFADWKSHRPEVHSEIRTGTVISRDMTFVAGVLRRPLLTVKVDGASEIFESILLANASRDVPDRVSFYFPPQDRSDLQLLEETSSLVVAAVMSVLTASCGLVLLLGKLRTD